MANVLRILALAGVASWALAAAPVAAQTLTPTAAGAYSPTAANATGASGAPNGNFLTGAASGESRRSYLIYSIPAGQLITSATLSLSAALVADGPNTINVYDVSTTPSTIAAGTATPGSTYTDLGTGVVFGTAVATTNSETLTITLSADAITAINAARGSSIAFGFNNETLSAATDYVFGGSINSTPRSLILVSAPAPAPVPTLSEWAMIMLGLTLAGGAALYLQRRRQIG
ncbi:IPTL-CTERM sorting domain-containing protein [Brevundimonas sp. NIBR11]|uniref:IPTL-CTERM sorting domain-containing protein n=1 Tax=Brevundimonas sp. NIBR11 TaxID=3015999 RepID=UPI0022F0655D|nr:IPTL-CTERM sorting domain-containing protein [Brevundimonas sp. NIBR11]WGM32182.1 hypothetical protein KKHFBJBL_02433 [Brevundimonas sp. NIBR11]